MKLSKLASIINGVLIGNDVSIKRFIIDGRKAQKEDCYIALKGDTFDGHNFINQAIENHATSAIVSHVLNHALPVILVEDTSLALAQLATYHRNQFTLPVLALTGSCGKTTVKEMIKSILPSTAFVSPGNLNNHIGVPLSLLSLCKAHSCAIFELGANHKGEILKSAGWVIPKHSLITNIAPAHLEGFGSIEGVEIAKGEIFKALPPEGTALINLDDSRIVNQSKKHLGPKITYSYTDQTADITAINLKLNGKGNYHFELHHQNQIEQICLTVPGKHNVSNALSAAAAAISLNIGLTDIKKGLESFAGVNGRLAIIIGRNNVKLIDDSYNANLHSVKTAIDVLSTEKNQKILILGELAEVGNSLNDHYKEIGSYAKEKHIDKLYTLGENSQIAQNTFGKNGLHFNDKKGLLKNIINDLNAQTTLLIKGSRSAKMENIIHHLI